MKKLLLIIFLMIPYLLSAQIKITGDGTADFKRGQIVLQLIPEKPDHVICFFYYHHFKLTSMEFKADINTIQPDNLMSYIKDGNLIAEGPFNIYYPSGTIKVVSPRNKIFSRLTTFKLRLTTYFIISTLLRIKLVNSSPFSILFDSKARSTICLASLFFLP